MIIWYGLDHQPISQAEANELLGDINRCRVAATEIGEVMVSTVFLVLNHNYTGDGPPVLYETMIFGGPHSDRQWRYPTREAALAGHNQAVTLARDPDAPGDEEPVDLLGRIDDVVDAWTQSVDAFRWQSDSSEGDVP